MNESIDFTKPVWKQFSKLPDHLRTIAMVNLAFTGLLILGIAVLFYAS
jgi:hypothetical protein